MRRLVKGNERSAERARDMAALADNISKKKMKKILWPTSDGFGEVDWIWSSFGVGFDYVLLEIPLHIALYQLRANLRCSTYMHTWLRKMFQYEMQRQYC